MTNQIKKYESPDSFGQILDRVRNCSSIAEVITMDQNAISVHRKHNGPQFIIDEITIYVNAFQLSINLNQKLTAFQVSELVAIITKRFYFLSLSEIIYIFERVKSNIYPIPKFAINIPDVITWFDSYTEERTNEFQKGRAEHHAKVKSGDPLKEMFVDTDGKTKLRQKKILDDGVVQALSIIKSRMPDNENDFQEFKSKPIELIDNSDNEELKRMQREAIEKYPPSNTDK
jgi:hypothetical protein